MAQARAAGLEELGSLRAEVAEKDAVMLRLTQEQLVRDKL